MCRACEFICLVRVATKPTTCAMATVFKVVEVGRWLWCTDVLRKVPELAAVLINVGGFRRVSIVHSQLSESRLANVGRNNTRASTCLVLAPIPIPIVSVDAAVATLPICGQAGVIHWGWRLVREPDQVSASISVRVHKRWPLSAQIS